VLGSVAYGVAIARVHNLSRYTLLTGASARAGAVLAAFYAVSYLVIGAVVASRRPKHPVGWLLLGIGAGFLLDNVASFLAINGYSDRAHPSLLGEVSLVVWGPLLEITVALVAWLVLVFPTGVVKARWWRAARWVGGLAFVDILIFNLVQPTVQPSVGTYPNPLRIVGDSGALKDVGWPASLLLGVLAFGIAVDLVVRWRRSIGAERQQMKFFGYAVLLAVVLLVSSPLLSPNGQRDVRWNILLFVALNALAVATGLAVVRFHLFEIDRVMSRAVSYALVTGVLVGVYVGVVTLVTRVLGFSSPVAVAASTLAAVALFNPLRVRVQRVVDRRFNRAHYDAEATVVAFTARLRDAVDLETVRSELLEVVNRVVEPVHASVWIRQRESE